mgnify:CR=1 FL=1
MKKKLAEQGISYEGPSLVVNQGEEDTSSNMAGKPVVGRLTDDRIRRLENIGFTWSLRDDWQKHYDELKGKAVRGAFSERTFLLGRV